MKIISRQEAKSRGLTRYFTGKPCKHGHVAERLIGNSGCAECDRLRAKAKNAAWVAKNPEKRKAQKKRHYEKNKPKVLAACAEYREANKEAICAYFKRYKQENKAKVNAISRRRNAAKKQRTPAWLTADDFWIMKEVYKLAQLRSRLTGIKWHVDHIVPLQGKTVSGLHVPTNLQVIPYKDNILKGNNG